MLAAQATILIESPLPPEEVLARLRAATGPRTWRGVGRVPHLFEGEIRGNRVEVRRVFDHESRPAPLVEADVEPAPGGSRLQGTFSLGPLSTAFTAIWFGLVMVVATGGIVVAIREGMEEPLLLLVPIGMGLAGWAAVTIRFWREAREARGMLADLLGAAPGAPADWRTLLPPSNPLSQATLSPAPPRNTDSSRALAWLQPPRRDPRIR